MFKIENKITKQNFSISEFPFRDIFVKHLEELNIKDIDNLHNLTPKNWMPTEKY